MSEETRQAYHENLRLKREGEKQRLEEVGADGVDTMSDGSIYKMIMDSEAEQ